MATVSNTVQVYSCIIDSPLGSLLAAATDQGLCYLEFQEDSERTYHFSQFCKKWKLNAAEGETCAHLEVLQTELVNYFNQNKIAFQVPLHLFGSSFQVQVWNFLTQIPYGSSCSYEALSQKMKMPLGIRAIANANGSNPIAIVVPCHRVIGKNGHLTGYAGGLWRKKWLLEFEHVHAKQLEIPL